MIHLQSHKQLTRKFAYKRNTAEVPTSSLCECSDTSVIISRDVAKETVHE